MPVSYDYVVIGAGSAGCVAAGLLHEERAGRVLVVEAGASDRSMLVQVPFLLIFLMGGHHDWGRKTVPMDGVGGRSIDVPRGRIVGGSGSFNSMLWFRGRRDDYDSWNLPGWKWEDVEPVFEKLEKRMEPDRIPSPHPLAEALGGMISNDKGAPPTPEHESTGVFFANQRGGWRWSSSDAYLRPATKTGLEVRIRAQVDRIEWEGSKAKAVRLVDGRKVQIGKGLVLAAGTIESPAILMRSGFGPADHLKELGIDVIQDLPGVGDNLHDHPTVGVHHAGPGSGYGLSLSQLPGWALSPLYYLATGKGRLSSTVVEAGAFLKAANGENGKPDVQVHLIPAMLGWEGKPMVFGDGYYADVSVSRPVSRGTLRLASKDPLVPPKIDLGILREEKDMDLLVAGFKRMRKLLADAPFGKRRAKEAFPGEKTQSDDEMCEHIKNRAATSYHPVGTLKMGGDGAPVAPDLKLRGSDNVWIADASVIPSITSSNINAPSMMVGSRVVDMVKKSA